MFGGKIEKVGVIPLNYINRKWFYQLSSLILNLVDSTEAVKARNWFAGYAMFGAGVTTGNYFLQTNVSVSRIADRYLTECSIVR